MGKNPKIGWLERYLKLQCQVENREDTLARLENSRYLPGMPTSDGSKHNPGATDRMANASVRYMAYKERVTPTIQAYKAEMQAIWDAVDEIDDPMEREVLFLRYIEGEDGYRRMKWRNVALRIYHNDDEADLTRVHRLHGAALLSLQLEGGFEDEENDIYL